MENLILFGSEVQLKQILLLSALVVLTTGVGSAALVDFTTINSVLSCGIASNCSDGGGNVISFGISTGGSATLQITYEEASVADLDVDPLATTNFGRLSLLCLMCDGATGNFVLTGSTLDLLVMQGPDPFADSGTFGTGQLSGTLKVANGNFGGLGQVAWTAPATFMLVSGNQTVGYTLQQPMPPDPPAYFLAINETTSVQGFVTFSQQDEGVPEPGTYALIALGLFGIGSLKFRR